MENSEEKSKLKVTFYDFAVRVCVAEVLLYDIRGNAAFNTKLSAVSWQQL